MMMDKKTQKRVTVLREKVQKLQKLVAGIRTQNDDPEELQRLEADLSKTKEELAKLLTS